MHLSRWLILLSGLEFYFYSNLVAFGADHRNIHLLVLIGLFSIAGSFPSLMSMRSTVVRCSLFLTALFITYYAYRCAYDLPLHHLWARFFGSDAGIVYYYVFGLTVSLPLQRAILVSWTEAPRYNRLAWRFLIFSLVSSLTPLCLTIEALSRTRSDIFLVAENDELYQWPGDLLTIRFILITATIGIWLIVSRGNRSILVRLARATIIVSFFSQIFASAFYLQIIGSNKAVVMISGCFIITIWLLSSFRGTGAVSYFYLDSRGRASISYRKALQSLWRPVLYSFILLLGIALLALALDFPFEKFRLFGFGSGENSSIDSRLFVLEHKFDKQFAIAPFLGNAGAEVAAGGGEGEYVHSLLLYLLTHTGLLGFSLFLLAVAKAVVEAKILNNVPFAADRRDLDTRSLIHLLYLALFGMTFLTAVLGTSVLWAPLWFALGFLLSPISIGMRDRASALG